MSVDRRQFAAQPFPRRGKFEVRDNPSLVELCVRALEMGPRGGVVSIQGHAVFITEVAVHPGLRGSATVRFRRVPPLALV